MRGLRVGPLHDTRIGAGHQKDQVIGGLELATPPTNFREAGMVLEMEIYKNS